MATVVGWDIGGAHLKAARAEEGQVVAAIQVAAPLRFGLERLAQSFAEAKARIGSADRHVITMTGELADTFSSRTEGALSLTATAVRELGEVAVYAGRGGFISPADVGGHVTDIASANWFASASIVAKTISSALLIDLGSTTTDIIPIVSNTVAARGYTDAERLATGELVYTGVVRSFLMATAETAPFAGSWTGLVHENFSNMGDVHRILGTLPEGADQMMTADGREKTVEASEARLARMIGHDRGDADGPAWTALAQWFAEAQIRAISDGAMLVLSQNQLPSDTSMVVAGIGETVLHEVARRLGRKCIGFDRLIDVMQTVRSAAAASAPAAALALLGSALAGTGALP
ncbi:MAG TPA: hydantoinase/oxoprolinase family protein [Pseudolabrys sp.]|nr:hydantoinase/oxoprolinase family protein [Pseudolabrys sp.]